MVMHDEWWLIRWLFLKPQGFEGYTMDAVRWKSNSPSLQSSGLGGPEYLLVCQTKLRLANWVTPQNNFANGGTQKRLGGYPQKMTVFPYENWLLLSVKHTCEQPFIRRQARIAASFSQAKKSTAMHSLMEDITTTSKYQHVPWETDELAWIVCADSIASRIAGAQLTQIGCATPVLYRGPPLCLQLRPWSLRSWGRVSRYHHVTNHDETVIANSH